MMNSSTVTVNLPMATDVQVSDETLRVWLSDGRVVDVPILWYLRLSHAKAHDREVWELMGGGHGINWPELDEDISVENILMGQPSTESGQSFTKWKQWYRQKRDERH